MKLSKWSYFLAVFLKVLAVLYSAVLVISGIMILRGGEVSFNLIPYESSPLVMSTEYSLSADKVNTNVANGVGFFVALTGVILLVWVLWLASEAFKDFAKGKTPFSEQNAKRIKKNGLLNACICFCTATALFRSTYDFNTGLLFFFFHWDYICHRHLPFYPS
ncbi:DUF2975 domain-containing protein [Listeria fleischmannii]|uniref:Uncharacterized protein n=1 Tax=Listeria fleischmannii FSL S10-1203 TaxID=1265822 RepID=W7DM72_9LIST|nr:DUF2975 domain-containing protein [Listeria fleischmannii]EUJ53186.1 hypothetical protein MCOL2_11372 [Listeria fleischmannii FSL S10-1203]